jgi:hypothetical protein
MKELSDTASDSIIGKTPNLNEIYTSNDLDEEKDFIPVIDAIQGEGFNPLWRQILIVFNEGFPLTSSSLKRRSMRLPPEPIPKSLSSRQTKSIVVRLLAGNSPE